MQPTLLVVTFQQDNRYLNLTARPENSDTDTRPSPNEVEICLLWGTRYTLSTDLFWQQLREPISIWMLVITWLSLAISSFLNPDPYWMLTLSSLALAFVVFFASYLFITAMWIRSLAKDGTRRIYPSRAIICAVLIAAAVHCLFLVTLAPDVLTDQNYAYSNPTYWVVSIFMFWLLIEVGSYVLQKLTTESYLRKHANRRNQGGATVGASFGSLDRGTLASQVYLHAPNVASIHEKQPAQVDRRQIELRDMSFQAIDILAITAQRNYVNITTRTESHLVAGPFSEVVAGVDSIEGFQIHRSCWIAQLGIQRIKRQDGKILVEIANGDVLTVSRPRTAPFKSWIKDIPNLTIG